MREVGSRKSEGGTELPRTPFRVPRSAFRLRPGGDGRRPILLTGATGQIGWELRRTLAPLGELAAPGRAELDLSAADAIRAAVRAIRPTLIVNAGAYTAVDAAERETDAARAINTTAPGILAEEAARLNLPLVHYSTDYVFPGSGSTPYIETDATDPVNAYGATKLAGERAIREAGAAHLIFRTSWIYGLRGANFLRTMRRLAREREELRVVDDQIGAPTWSRMVAEATALVLARCASNDGFTLPDGAGGTYHLTAAGETSWYGFAREILARDPAPHEQRCRSVVAVATPEFPTPARRPAYSVLDNGRIAAVFGVHLPHWKDQLDLLFTDLAACSAAAGVTTASAPIASSRY